MTRAEYSELITEGLVSDFRGNLNRSSFDFKDRQHFEEVYKKVEPIMLKQLTDDFDINNCIIVIPVNTGYGSNYLWNNREIIDSHCTDSVTIRYKLHKMGMKEFDGNSLIKNTQLKTAMFIIDNGVVYCSTGDYPSANPLKSFWLTPDTFETKILQNKPIFFSGFFIERLKNNG